jgi:hypothetical protein
MQLEMDAIKHRFTTKIEGILYMRQTHMKGKEYLVKYKGCYHKEAIYMKPTHLEHLQKMVNKFEQERGHELGVKSTWKKKKDPPANGLNVDEDINF